MPIARHFLHDEFVWRFFKKIRKKTKKTFKNDEFGGFGPGNELLRRFGGNPSKNRPNRCLGGDFLGQIKFVIFCFFQKMNNQDFLRKNKKTTNFVLAQKVAAKAPIWTIFCGISAKSPQEFVSGAKTPKFVNFLRFFVF